jgi:tRNA A37 methylthiotransferase MiaB
LFNAQQPNNLKEAMKMENQKSVYLITNGCLENRNDMALIRDFFEKNGWKIVDNYLHSDLILFNACALTEFHEHGSIKIIKILKAYKPSGTPLIVCGCLPKINKKKLMQFHDGMTLYGEDDTYKLNDIIQADFKIDGVYANYLCPYKPLMEKPNESNIYADLFYELFHMKSEFRSTFRRFLYAPILYYDNWLNSKINVFHGNRRTFFIKIATGCLNRCAYCAVKNSRGNLKSKSLSRVMDEFRSGMKQGYKYFSLLGTDLGPYGSDIGIDLATLLHEMIQEDGDYSIRIRNIQPHWLNKLFPQFREVLKTKKISYMGIPIESGNNAVLRAMRRGYKIEDVKESIRQLNKEFPFIFLRTQLMTGFPGETLEQFYDSYRLVSELCFDYVEVYPFSPRPDTLALKMKNTISTKEAVRRRNKLWFKALLINTPRRLRKIHQS